MNKFYIRDDNGKLWVEVIIFTFLDAQQPWTSLQQAIMMLILLKPKLCILLDY